MANVVSLDSAEHRRTQELLPWFVNATLADDEAAGVAAHLEQCARCQVDAEAQAALRAIAVDDEHAESLERSWAALAKARSPTVAGHVAALAVPVAANATSVTAMTAPPRDLLTPICVSTITSIDRASQVLCAPVRGRS